jgi:hypothetical protein
VAATAVQTDASITETREGANNDKSLQSDDDRNRLDGDEGNSVAHSRTSTDTTGSVSGVKHTSSIFTGPIEGRESMDASSVTTPTSERPFSTIGEAAVDDTPKKTTQADDKPDEEAFVAARIPLSTIAN